MKRGRGGSCGAMVLGKLTVPGRPTYLDSSRARSYCACSRCGWGMYEHFSLVYHSFFLPSLWETALYRLKYCLKGPLCLKNQPTNSGVKSLWLNFVEPVLADVGFSHIIESPSTFSTSSLLTCIKNKLKEKVTIFLEITFKF